MMIKFIFYRKLTKSYFLLVPIALYMCVMYRMLETTCFDNNKYQSVSSGIYVPSETKTRKIVQFKFRNSSKLLKHLAEEYEYIERQRSFLIQRIQNAVKAADSSLEYSDLSDHLPGHVELNIPSDLSNSFKYKPAFPASALGIKKPQYMFNCSNTYRIKLMKKIGHGVSKQTFQGEYKGQRLAVKMVTRHQSEVKTCLDKLIPEEAKSDEKRSRCFVFSTMKLMKEILLLEQLDHPGFARLLGYCIRSEESDTSDLSERGVVSVLELGQRFVLNNLQTLPWRERLKHAISLADFLNYLQHSPLGSLRVRDFKESHFLMINNSIKMIDLDDVDNLEPSCNAYVNSDHHHAEGQGQSSTGCEFGLPCQRGLCIGFNAKQNMKYMNRIFFKRLLFPNSFPQEILAEMSSLNVDIDNLSITAQELQGRLLKLYNTGS